MFITFRFSRMSELLLYYDILEAFYYNNNNNNIIIIMNFMQKIYNCITNYVSAIYSVAAIL